jgi:hypothetical protein
LTNHPAELSTPVRNHDINALAGIETLEEDSNCSQPRDGILPEVFPDELNFEIRIPICKWLHSR